MTDHILDVERQQIRAIGGRHGATRLRVFGSRARGDAGQASDFDLLVDFAPGRSLMDLIGLKQDLEDVLGHKVDVVTEDALSPYLREQVLREAKEL